VPDDLPAPAADYPSVLRMAAPLMVSFFLRGAFTFVDTAYAAIIGDSAVAAIGLTVPFEFLMIAIWVGMSTGLTSNLSRSVGAREGEKIDQYLKAAWRLVLAVSPAFALIGVGIWFAAPHIGLAEPVWRGFRIYGTVLMVGSALTAFWAVIPDSVVKAHQDTRSTMWAGILSSIINITLNTVFLFVFHWGLFGIALSTVLSRVGSLIYALHRARIHEDRRKASAEPVQPGRDPRPYRTLMLLAVPASITFALMAGEAAMVNILLAGTAHATEAIAAFSIYSRVFMLLLSPIIAAAVAMLPYVARRFGERDEEGIRRGLSDAGRACLLYSMVVVGPALLLSASWLAGMLAESPITARYAAFGLRLVPVACIVTTAFILCRPVFEGMNQGRPGLVMAILRYLVLATPGAWLGMKAARSLLGLPEIYGLVTGLLVVAAASSIVFSLWLRRTLAEAFAPGSDGSGATPPASP